LGLRHVQHSHLDRPDFAGSRITWEERPVLDCAIVRQAQIVRRLADAQSVSPITSGVRRGRGIAYEWTWVRSPCNRRLAPAEYRFQVRVAGLSKTWPDGCSVAMAARWENLAGSGHKTETGRNEASGAHGLECSIGEKVAQGICAKLRT
jgi:hypothetical protein